MEGRMKIARVLLIPFVLILAGYFSVCNFNQYSDRTGLKIVAKFPSSNIAQNTLKLAKPLNSPVTYVPGFVNRISVLIAGNGFSKSYSNVRTGDSLLNEFAEIEELSYGDYNVSIQAFALNKNGIEIGTYQANKHISVGSGIGDSNIVVDLDVLSGTEIDSGEIVEIGSVTSSEIVKYCPAISEMGEFQVFTRIAEDGIEEDYSYFMNSNGIVSALKPVHKDLMPMSEDWNCVYGGNTYLLPGTEGVSTDSLAIYLSKNDTSGVDQKIIYRSSDIKDTVNAPYIDAAFGKVAVVWTSDPDPTKGIVYGKIFDSALLESEEGPTTIMGDPPTTFLSGSGYSKPKVKIIKEHMILVTAVNQYNQIEAMTYEKVDDWKPFSETWKKDGYVDHNTKNYSLEYSGLYGILLGLDDPDGNYINFTNYLKNSLFDINYSAPDPIGGLPGNVSEGSVENYRNGNLVAAWSFSGSADDSEVFYKILNPVNGDGGVQVVSLFGFSTRPSLTFDSDGLGLILWISDEDPGLNKLEKLYYKRMIF
jgi:hypothetical protein